MKSFASRTIFFLIIMFGIAGFQSAFAQQAGPIDASECIQHRIEKGPPVSYGDMKDVVWLTNTCDYWVRLVVCSLTSSQGIPICSLEMPLMPNVGQFPWGVSFEQGETYRYRFNACAHPVPGRPHHDVSTCHPGTPSWGAAPPQASRETPLVRGKTRFYMQSRVEIYGEGPWSLTFQQIKTDEGDTWPRGTQYTYTEYFESREACQARIDGLQFLRGRSAKTDPLLTQSWQLILSTATRCVPK